jgi:predicted nuclease of predicted toxin-antitoxin system
MKFKLDENFGTRTQRLFMEAGYDVQTVRQQNLQGTPDSNLYEVCKAEERCLITLDLDFSNVFRFPPENTAGIIVIRPPKNPNLPMLESLVRQCLHAMKNMRVENQLWIVESGRLRIHQSNREA